MDNPSETLSTINTFDNSKSFPRKRRHLVGLLNQGGTCYLNSLLQTLFHTPEFTYRLFKLTTRSNPSGLKSIIRELLRLFYGLMALKKYAISSKPLTDSFGWTDGQVFVHQDVQELNRLLFEEIELALKGTVEANIIKDLYRGVLSTKIQCLRCGYCSTREDEYLDVNLAVIRYDSVELCLRAQTATERLSGDNQYFCGNCNIKVDAIKTTHFKEYPPILTLCLSRFDYDPKTMESIKVDKCCTFPISLDMSEFMEYKQKQKILYDLFSILIHVGNSTLGGHYHAYIKDPYGFEKDVEDNENNAKENNFNLNGEKLDLSQICTDEPLANPDILENETFTKVSERGESIDNSTVAKDFDQLNSLNMDVDIDNTSNTSESSNQNIKKNSSKFAVLIDIIKGFWTGSNLSANITEISQSGLPELNLVDSSIPEVICHNVNLSHHKHLSEKNLSTLSDTVIDQFSETSSVQNNEVYSNRKFDNFDSNICSNIRSGESERSNTRTETSSNVSKTNSRSQLTKDNKMKFQSTSTSKQYYEDDSKFSIKMSHSDIPEKHKIKSTFVESGRWFDFNDETITEIKQTDFQKVFQGPECAYMLFYRNKNLITPG